MYAPAGNEAGRPAALDAAVVLIRLAQLRSQRAAAGLPQDRRRVPGALFRRRGLARVPLRLSLAGRFPLSGMRLRAGYRDYDAPSVAVPGLPAPSVGDCRHGPA